MFANLQRKLLSVIPVWSKTRSGLRRAGARTAGPRGEFALHLELGRRGETWAISYLERAGYHIVAANFAVPIGRNTRGAIVNAEIDIVAYDGPTLCFIEVKTRASDWFAPPEVNVDLRKQRQIIRAARAYRRMLNLTEASCRYDVLSVILPPDEDGNAAPPSGTLLKNYWSEGKFRKREWRDGDY